MARKENPATRDGRVAIREGYQGKDLPPGVRPIPPKGPAADVPVKAKNPEK